MPMAAAEYSRTEVKVPNDARALGAVRGALQHTARHLGLSAKEEDQLIAAADGLLSSALKSIGAEDAMYVGIQEHADRIEVELRGSASAPGTWAAASKLAGIDEVEQETSADGTRIMLVKYLPGTGNPSHLKS